MRSVLMGLKGSMSQTLLRMESDDATIREISTITLCTCLQSRSVGKV